MTHFYTQSHDPEKYRVVYSETFLLNVLSRCKRLKYRSFYYLAFVLDGFSRMALFFSISLTDASFSLLVYYTHRLKYLYTFVNSWKINKPTHSLAQQFHWISLHWLVSHFNLPLIWPGPSIFNQGRVATFECQTFLTNLYALLLLEISCKWDLFSIIM